MKIVTIDTETTGLKAWEHGIHQLGMIIEIDGVEKFDKNYLIRPDRSLIIDEDALAISGTSKSDLDRYEPEVNAVSQIVSELKKYVDPFNKDDKFTMRGHNIGFDKEFIVKLFSRTQRDRGDSLYFGSFFYYNRYIDTMHVANWLRSTDLIYLPESSKLTDLCDHYEISSTNAHNALADCKMTIALSKAMEKEVEGRYGKENRKEVTQESEIKDEDN